MGIGFKIHVLFIQYKIALFESMKLQIRLLLLFILSAFTGLKAQNTPPRVIIWSANVNTIAQTITLQYQLIDAQNHPCRIWMKYSKDGGQFFDTVIQSQLSGDAGSGILPGARTITWNYAGLSGTIYNTKIKLYASDNQPIDISEIVKKVDSSRVYQNLKFVCGERNINSAPNHFYLIRDSIERIFKRNQLLTEKDQFSYNAQTGVNILGLKAGAIDEKPTVVVDAHYDGVVGTPGADDNATGVAGMLEAVRVLSGYEYENSIRFIGFDFEEAGLIGSQRYVQNGIKKNETITGVLNLEMIGYYTNKANTQSLPTGFNVLFPDVYNAIIADSSRGNFIVVCGNANSNSLINDYMKAASTYVPKLKALSVEVPSNGQIAPDLRRSDHASFWDNNNKALMMTDGSNFRNKNYHKPSDTIGSINLSFMTNVTKATIATAAMIAKPISAGYDDLDLSTLSYNAPHLHNTEMLWTVYPNPSDGNVSVKINADNFMHAKMELYDLNGKLIWEKVFELKRGDNEVKPDFKNLKAGNYLLNLVTEEGFSSKELVITP